MEAEQAAVDPNVASVHFIATGSGEQHREHRYGTSKPTLWWVLTSQSWVKVPIGAYVMRHRDAVVLFDTGMDPAISKPSYITSPIGRFLLRKIFRLHIGPEDALGRQRETLGVSAGDVRKR